jgi:hypothetical protein
MIKGAIVMTMKENTRRTAALFGAGFAFLAWIPMDLKSPKEMAGMRPGAKL